MLPRCSPVVIHMHALTLLPVPLLTLPFLSLVIFLLSLNCFLASGFPALKRPSHHVRNSTLSYLLSLVKKDIGSLFLPLLPSSPLKHTSASFNISPQCSSPAFNSKFLWCGIVVRSPGYLCCFLSGRCSGDLFMPHHQWLLMSAMTWCPVLINTHRKLLKMLAWAVSSHMWG